MCNGLAATSGDRPFLSLKSKGSAFTLRLATMLAALLPLHLVKKLPFNHLLCLWTTVMESLSKIWSHVRWAQICVLAASSRTWVISSADIAQIHCTLSP